MARIIDQRLYETAQIIDSKFANTKDSNRAEISSDILPHIRNFCEVFMYKVYDEENNIDLFQTQDNLKIIRKFFKDNYFDIHQFHTLLDASVGHIDFGPMQSEALVIKYIPKLIILKDLLSKKYGIEVLQNIYKYPLDLDESITSFYEKILFVLQNSKCESKSFTRNQYFVCKKSMKYLNGCIFYEYVFDVSDDKISKFNTFVCYSFKNIRFNYDLKLILSKEKMTFLKTQITINVIHDYEYSIRPCAFKNLLHLINYDISNFRRDKEYTKLMQIIKDKNLSLVNIVDGKFDLELSTDGLYLKTINHLKEFINKNSLGTNTIRFLLSDMRNSVIKAQTYKSYRNMPLQNEKFNNLMICQGTKSFELMPFAFNPKKAKPSLHTLFELFDFSTSKEEILYHYLDDYINQNNTIFIKPSDIGYENKIFIKLMNSFNDKLVKTNSYYSDYKIINEHGYYTIEAYLSMTKDTISHALGLCNVVNICVNNNYDSNTFLSIKQKEILSKVFKHSSIALISGAAGTGKTSLLKEFIKNNADRSILCLTTTNTANNNIKIEGLKNNIEYKNISQFENEKKHGFYDVIIIDEASFVSTKAIKSIFDFYENSIFLISGDPEQIESIEFGNWYNLLLNLLKKKNVVYELYEEHRTKINEISKIWNEVRNGNKKNILELLSAFCMSEKINEDIFNTNETDVVLCLNYDGLYGINNINRYLQASNPNQAYEYQQNLYKVGDPVIFIINDYTQYGIYNNLKGKIVDIKDDSENISFKIQLFDNIDFEGRLSYEVSIENENNTCYAIVKKMKYYNDKYDMDMDTRTKLPFQISYAMSVHKAQGLEFDSVKIVITKESDELITKNIFYTAVTRAKKNLKIYWEPEVANYVLDNIENSTNSEKADLTILLDIIKNLESNEQILITCL